MIIYQTDAAQLPDLDAIIQLHGIALPIDRPFSQGGVSQVYDREKSDVVGIMFAQLDHYPIHWMFEPSTNLVKELQSKMDAHGYVLVHGSPHNNLCDDDFGSEYHFELLGKAFGQAVRYENEGVDGVVSVIKARANTKPAEISGESNAEFKLHTDGTYEESPPKVFGLQAIQPDYSGECQSQVALVDDIIPLLSEASLEELQKRQFAFPLPKRAIYDGREEDSDSVIHSVC